MTLPHPGPLVDRAIAAIIRAARWLVLPVSLLLFLQWPLRDLLRLWSVQANDLAQWMFALYVAVAVTHATRVRAHLAIDGLARRLPQAAQSLVRHAGALFAILPWAIFVLVAGSPAAWRAMVRLEAFPETSDPGYWIVKLSAMLLALLLAAQASLDLSTARDP
jgi:TRAP-type mannitol/chloroaromatic compound transport system permease small subunit